MATQTRLKYFGVVLGTFVLIDFLFTFSGLAAYAWQSLGVGFVATVVGVIYMVFAQAFPLGILLLFAGRDPSVLWASARKPKEKPSSVAGHRR